MNGFTQTLAYIAMEYLPGGELPVLIGDSDFGTRWPVLKRPIQWINIFEAFDHALNHHEGAKPVSVS